MKQNYLYLLLSSALIISCQKEPEQGSPPPGEDDGCIERIHSPVTAHSINTADILTADSLFSANAIDKTNSRYSWYTHDSVQTYYPPFVKYDEKIVVVEQYSKGIWATYTQILYYFKNNVLSFTNGTPLSANPLDTSAGNLNIKQLRKLFMDDNIAYQMGKYKDSCYTAEFVYYNQNPGYGNQERLIKAWKLSIKGRSTSYTNDVPVGYYQMDGKRIWYTNGIVAVR